MRLRTQLLLSSVALLLIIVAVVNQFGGIWNLLILELAGIALYAAAFFIVTEFLLRGLERVSKQTAEVLAGGRAALTVEGTSFEVKRLISSLDDLLLRLQASKKAMHQFLGDASHELRTPLTVISAYLQLLAQPESLAKPDYVAKSVEKMTTEANRMQRLIDDLLQLAEIGENAPLGHTVPVDIAAMVTFEVESLRDLQPGRPVIASVAGPLFVQGNPDLLAQLVANLFANLRRHTAASAEVHVELMSGASWVTLTCNDAGPGLTDEAYEAGIQHFQRYDQGRSRETGGSGLGMSIMASIVERHGGQIALTKSSLGGLCTRITLPA